MSRLDRLPLPLAPFFYAAALGAVLVPYLAAAPAGERFVRGVYTLTVALYGALTLLVLHQRPGDSRGELFMFLGLGVSLTLLFNAANVRVGDRLRALGEERDPPRTDSTDQAWTLDSVNAG